MACQMSAGAAAVVAATLPSPVPVKRPLLNSFFNWVVATAFAFNVIYVVIPAHNRRGVSGWQLAGTETVEAGWYNIDSIPSDVLTYLRRWVSKDPHCLHDPTTLVVSCCHSHCGGLADRVRGLAAVIRAARYAGRQICLTREFFIVAKRPVCKNGGWRWISTTTDYKLESVDTLQGIRYLSANRIDSIPELGLEGQGSIDTKRIGAAIVAYSGVIDRDMKAAQNLIFSGTNLSRIAEDALGEHVSLHVRCGGGSFSTAEGVRVKCLTWNDGHKSTIPDLLLQAVRAVPRDTICRRKLYLASDSARYRSALAISMPPGVVTVTCCSPPVHIDYVRSSLDANQHLVDIAALAMSRRVFATKGGYGELGAVSGDWQGVPIRAWDESDVSNTTTQGFKYIQDLLAELECWRSKRNTP